LQQFFFPLLSQCGFFSHVFWRSKILPSELLFIASQLLVKTLCLSSTTPSIPRFCRPHPMTRKRRQPTSSSPNYQQIVWKKTQTGRGTKVVRRVVVSPGTPKAIKPPIPQSKRRRLEETPATMRGSSPDGVHSLDPIRIEFPKTKKRGKVRQSL